MKKNKYLWKVIFLCIMAITGCNKEDESVIVPFVETQQESSQEEKSKPQTVEMQITEEVIEETDYLQKTVQDSGDDKLELHRNNPQIYYAFSMLEEPLQRLYLEILNILENRQENVDVSTLSTEEIDIAFQCVLIDHPEIFYVQGYKYTKFTKEGNVNRVAVSGTYTMTDEEIQNYQAGIDTYVNACLSGVSNQLSEYDKVKYVYEYIIANTEYNLSSLENQNICSVFLYRQSVCQGYAKAMQYVLNKLGIFCTLITGTVDNGEGHAWNLVRIDNAYYYVDVTWGDAFYEFDSAEGATDQSVMPSINYDYLCVTTEQLSRTHNIDNVVPVPRCISMDANYYVREGVFFSEYDETKIGNLFALSYEKGLNYITLKCSSSEIYQEILRNLIEKQKVFQYLRGNAESIAYTVNEKQQTISFWLS